VWAGRDADEKHTGTTAVETNTTLAHTRLYVGYLTPMRPYAKITSLFAVHVTVHRRHSEGNGPARCDKVCGFYCLNMFRAPICPSSGVQLVSIFRCRWPYLESRLGCAALHEDVARVLFTPRSPVGTTQAAFQVWPPKSGRYSLIVLLTVGILVPETC
jgi:hypothetical protein